MVIKLFLNAFQAFACDDIESSSRGVGLFLKRFQVRLQRPNLRFAQVAVFVTPFALRPGDL